MRHFRSILYAVVLAPAVWVLVGAGLTHDLTARGRDGFAVESLSGLVLLLLGGAAYGILVFAPISPLGPSVAGLVFLGVGVWAVEWPAAYLGAWPSGMVKDGFDLSRPGYGLAPLLAVPLLLTALSMRRWSRFEPVVLPIIGTMGRTRGAAAPGIPVTGLQTTTLPALFGRPADDGESTTVLRVPEETTVLRRPEPAVAPEVAPVLPMPDDGEETTVLRAPVPREEAPTEDVATANEEPTAAIADEQPTDAVGQAAEAADDEATETIADERPTQAVDTVTETPGEEPTDAIADEQLTEDVSEEPALPIDGSELPENTEQAAEAHPSAETEPPAETEPAPEAEPTAETEQVAEAGDEPAEAAEAEEPVTSVMALVVEEAPDEDDDEVVMVEETTYLLMPADDDERTQAIRLNAAIEDDGGRTQMLRPVGYEPGQTTRDLGIPGDRTQVIWPAANRIPGERTVVFGQPGEQTRRIVRAPGPGTNRPAESGPVDDDGERTQVIRPARATPPREDHEPSPATSPGERTDPGLVTPPDAEVEPVRLPGDRTTTRTKAGPPRSIVGAESPNFADDPTGRLVSPPSMADEPTRTMTVMNLERPPDEVPEIPSQRQPTPDED